MTLGTHAAVGGSLAALVPSHPFIAFSVGFLSHFLLDSIPHYDYQLSSMVKDKNQKLNNDIKIGISFIFDLLRIFFDVFFGFAILFVFFRNSAAFPVVITVGAIGAMLPDALQFVYFKFRKEPILSLQRFHLFVHAQSDINHRPILGLFCQSLVVCVVLFLSLIMLQ